MRKVGHTVLLAATMTVSSWAFGHPVNSGMPTGSPESLTAARTAAIRYERTVESVDRLTAALHGDPARPGVRPAYIPRGAVTVTDQGTVTYVGLATALSGRAGSIVAWVP